MKTITSFPFNLVATQELGAPPPTPTINDFITLWPQSTLRGYKYTVNDLAQLISSVLGSGSLLPERRYLIDTDMPSGSSYVINGDGNGQINDPYLDGKVYDIHRVGALISKGHMWQNDVVGGGIRLLQPGDTFEMGEEIIATFTPQFSPYIPAPDAIGRFSNGEKIITATSTISAGDFRKIFILRGATNILTVTLPAASAYPANVILCIMSDGGSHKQATLRCNGSDNIFFNGTGWPDFWIRQNQQIILMSTTGGWRVIEFTGSDHFNRLGTTDLGSLQGPNQWNACTNPGPQSRAVYPGTWNFIQRLKAAQPAAVVSGAAWAANPTMWGEGDGSTTFNFPCKAGYIPRYLDPNGDIDTDRFVAGNGNLPGSPQLPMVGGHTHSDIEGDNSAHDSSSLPTSASTKLLVNLDDRGRNGHSQIQGGKTGNVAEPHNETRPYNVGELSLINI